jgi:RNA polymerase sigma-70 factor (ECF subfamily)
VSATLSNSQFLEFIEKHRHEFFRFARRTLWNPGAAEDVFSAAVLAAYENRGKFRVGTNFRAWMFRILTNKCFVANREMSRTPEPLEDHADFVALDRDPSYGDALRDPAAFLERCGDEVHEAFQKLSPSQRACILLRDVERFTYQEIAEILEIPVGTVMTHLARGRAKVRIELLDYARSQGIVRKHPRLLPRDTDVDGPEERSSSS